MDWMRWAATLTVVLVSVVLASVLRPVFLRLRRHSQQSRLDGIQVLSNLENPKFEIVAVHGLGADSEYTWTCKAQAKPPKSVELAELRRIHLLKDFLKDDFPEARILSFAHNSDWLSDAPSIPIIFIGHSFGGIIIKEALCKARDDELAIVDDTCGIIFLGTPHQGSPVSLAGAIVAFLNGFLGSDTTLLLSLKNHDKALSDLEDEFTECMQSKEKRRQKTRLISFHEMKPTYFLGISVGLSVIRDSAKGLAEKNIGIDVDHSGLNKCGHKEDQLYKRLMDELNSLRPTGQPTLNGNQQYVIKQLDPVESAAFNSHAEEHEAICHPETRFDLLCQIDEWANNPASEGIYWLQGKAGTGKSTISRTVAHKFAADKRLGASFFFKSGEGDRSKAARFFTTIAAQLVYQSPAMAEHVRNAIEADLTVPGKDLNEQFDKLILEPLKKVHGDIHGPLKTIVVVIDALDECDREENVRVIICLLSQTKSLTSVRLRFFVTSRPELPIQLGFKEISSSYTDLVLHEIPKPVIEHDIAAFLKYEFTKIRDDYNRIRPEDLSLPSDWPGQKNIQILVQMAVPLFIFAATVCRFVNDRTWSDPVAQLTKVLDYQTRTSDSELDKLDATYIPILN